MKTFARVVIACALLGSAAATLIAYRSDRPDTIAVVSVVIALMTLIVAVALHLLAKSRGLLQDQIDGALRRLASDVRRFWNIEAGNRGLIDNPIRTELRTAPAPAEVDPLPAVAHGKPMERRSVGGFAAWFGRLFGTDPTEARADAIEDIAPPITDADERTVTIQDMAAEWRSSSLRRFLLLGEPGSGKTSVLVNLLRALVNDRGRIEQARPPVPVLVSASGWNPSVPFHEWLRKRLEGEYPYLARRHRRSAGDRERTSIASELVASGLVIPFVDGIDEITEKGDRRREAIKRLNTDPMFADAPLAMTCRTADYRRAEQDGEFGLNQIREYELQPLEWQQAAAYLCRAEPTDGLPRTVPPRWRPVVDELARGDRSAALSEVMSTPLMVFLARTAFDDPEEDGPQPSELLELGTRFELEWRLAGEYLKAAYRPGAGRPRVSGRRLRNTEKILALTAKYLQSREKTDFVWWRIVRFEILGEVAQQTRYRWAWNTARRILRIVGYPGLLRHGVALPMSMSRTLLLTAAVPIAFVSAVLIWGIAESVEPSRSELAFILATLGGLSLTLTVPYAARISKGLRQRTSGPYQLYRSDRIVSSLQRSLLMAVMILLLLMLDFLGWDEFEFHEPSWWVYPAALAVISVCMVSPAMPSVTASSILDTFVTMGRLTGVLPWRPPFMRTLEDARRRQVLRQVGGAYQFRHRVIQEYLAEQTDTRLFG